MDEEEVTPSRKRPTHFPALAAGNRTMLVYVTICTKARVRSLASHEAHQAILKAWESASRWQVGRYVILPDHVHFFCAPGLWPPESLQTWMAYWKRLATLGIRKQSKDFKWQRDFWDTQLRFGESYAQKWEYVRNNPVRHQLVADAKDWPWQGELHELAWHDA